MAAGAPSRPIVSAGSETFRLFEARAGAYARAMMIGPSSMAEVAALVGDPARAHMLDALVGGRALAAGELALAAGIAPSTASGHLAKLTEARIVTLVRCGRHRYYRLASPLVGRMLESILAVAAIELPPRHRPRTPRDAALAFARTCYDHLAGRLAVGLTDALVFRRLCSSTRMAAR